MNGRMDDSRGEITGEKRKDHEGEIPGKIDEEKEGKCFCDYSFIHPPIQLPFLPIAAPVCAIFLSLCARDVLLTFNFE